MSYIEYEDNTEEGLQVFEFEVACGEVVAMSEEQDRPVLGFSKTPQAKTLNAEVMQESVNVKEEGLDYDEIKSILELYEQAEEEDIPNACYESSDTRRWA